MKRVTPLALLVAFSLSGCAVMESVANSHSHSAPADVKQVDEGSPYKGAWLDTPYELPKGKFIDTEGNSVVWPKDGLAAPVTIVFFGYTHCADGFCQTQTANAAAALRGLDASIREQVQFLFISSDPVRDTPAVLRAFLDQYDPTFIGYTGEFTDIAETALSLGVELEVPPSPAPATGYEVAHGTQLIGFGPEGTAPVVWLPETPIADLRADLKTLLAGE